MSREVGKEMLKAAVVQAAADPAYFCRFFLPHWFPTAMPPFHLGLLALITRKVKWLENYPSSHPFLLKYFRYAADPLDPTSPLLPIFQEAGDGRLRMVAGPNNAFILPRGFSKTTLFNAANLGEALTDPASFTVYISESSTHAEQQLGTIRNELESNDLLQQAYGLQVPTRADAEKWTGNQLQLLNGTILLAKGRGGQIRGTNIRARRPKRILLDDVEDEESIKTPEQRKKTLDWFYKSVVPAGKEMSGDTEADPMQITALGTLLGADTLLTAIAKDSSFNTVRFGATLVDLEKDEERNKAFLESLTDGQMLWPYRMNAQDYLKKRRRYQKVGQLSSFTLEYDSTVRNDEDAHFLQEFFYYEPLPMRSDLVQVALAMDPAISESASADYASFAVAARHKSGTIWVAESISKQAMKPHEKIQLFFALHKLYGCTKAGIEAQAYQKALIHMAREEMAARGYFFHIEAIVQSGKESKDQRILGMLQPRYRLGRIKHARRFPLLEQQLLDYPNGKKDAPDAVAMALKMLGETAMLVMPEEVSVTQDQFAPLEKALPPLYDQDSPFIFDGPSYDPLAGRYGGPT